MDQQGERGQCKHLAVALGEICIILQKLQRKFWKDENYKT